MKFQETSFDEYITVSEKQNYHPELEAFEQMIPNDHNKMGNLILYGASGVGKYTQMLRFIKAYSPSKLKYDKRITLATEKHTYTYRISDIHYEIDMEILGCNAKVVWHELFLQIVDIISMSQQRFGIIVCKNFHTIHSELLTIFYSYVQQYSNTTAPFHINFILLSEHISFLPNSIVNNMRVIGVKRPNDLVYVGKKKPDEIEKSCIMNLKELRLLSNIESLDKLPSETFDTICNTIIDSMDNITNVELTEFRDTLYDILIYNLDTTDVLWNVLSHYIDSNQLTQDSIDAILKGIHVQMMQYNNNYRPIYHLESIFLNIVTHIHKLPELC